MIEKIVAKDIKAELKQNSQSNPRSINFEKRTEKNSDDFFVDDAFSDYQSSTFLRNILYTTQNKYRVAYAMINAKKIDNKICKELKIDESFLQSIYSEYAYIQEYINSREQEWKDSVHSRAEEFDRLEREATAKFKERPLCEQILDKEPPRYFCQHYLDKLNKKVRDIRHGRNFLNIRLKDNKLSRIEYEEKIQELLNLERNARIDIKWILNRIDKNKVSQKRIDIIKASKRRKIASTGKIEQYIEIGNITRGHKLIDDYCRWYKIKNKLDIASLLLEGKNEKQRERYRKNNANKNKAADIKKQKEIEQVLKLHSEGMSARKMEAILSIGRTTIGNIIRSHKLLDDKD